MERMGIEQSVTTSYLSNHILIKELRIFNNTESDNTLRRKTIFHSGINFIVDEAEPGEKANNTGKTTALKIIDVCLGAKEKKYIYTDSKTDSLINNVYNEIVDHNITAELILVDTFDEDNSRLRHVLTVELKPHGNRYIDNQQYSQKEYKELLNEIIFKNNQDKPSFRQLIPKFVRIGLKEDKSNSFLRFLHSTTSNNEYRMIYDYLFGFSKNEENVSLIVELESKLKEEETYFKQLKRRHGDLSAIRQQIVSTKDYLFPQENRLELMVSGSDFKQKAKDLNEKRQTFLDIENEISSLKYEITKINQYLTMLNSHGQTVSETVLHELYNEVLELTSLKKTFTDLINFNEQLNNNQISFQNARKDIFSEKLRCLNSQKESLQEEYGIDLGLVRDIDIEEYNKLSDEVALLRKQISELERDSKEFEGTENNIEKLREEIRLLKENTSIEPLEIEKKWRVFNMKFMDNTQKICGESFNIIFTSEGFPIEISPIKEGLGTGRAKSLVAAFDISFLEYAHEYNLPVPYFIIHDVLENIDELSFSAITEKITDLVNRSIEVQYIGSILSEKIRAYEFIKSDMIVEKVSEHNKYLKIK